MMFIIITVNLFLVIPTMLLKVNAHFDMRVLDTTVGPQCWMTFMLNEGTHTFYIFLFSTVIK